MNDETDQVRATPKGDGHKCFECDDGWGPLISELEVKLKILSPGYRPSQVKEKFGGLRYYAWPAEGDEETSEAFFALIRDAEARSYEICECCGRPGQLLARGGRGWYKTLCPRCAEQLGFEPERDDDEDAET